MKKDLGKKIIQNLMIVLVFSGVFFVFQMITQSASLQITIVTSVILFAFLMSLPIIFLISDKLFFKSKKSGEDHKSDEEN